MIPFSPALRRQGRLLAAPALVVALAGCGQAQSAGQDAATRHTASAQVSSTATGQPSVSGPLAAVDPCAVLSPVERSTVGLSSFGKAKTIGEARACDWTEPGAFGVTV